MRSAKKKAYIIIILVLLCVAAFFGVAAAIERMEKTLYPLKYSSLVEKYAAEYNLPAFLVYTLIHTESKFEPMAHSSADAIGLTQITQETFDWVKSKIAKDEALEFKSLYEPENSIRFGCYYLSQCMLRYENDISTAAAAYHSGWGTVDKLLSKSEYSENSKTLNKFPYKQMNLYVKKINKSYARYIKLYG